MRTLSQTFSGTWPLQIVAKYFRLISISGASVDVRFFRGSNLQYEALAVSGGFYATPDGGFDRVDIISAGSQTVKIAVSSGEGGYDVVSVVGTITAVIPPGATIADNAAVAVGVAATQIVAASGTRRAVRFLNQGTAIVYLGGAGVTVAAGVVALPAGGVWVETDAPGAAWYGISGAPAQNVVSQECSA